MLKIAFQNRRRNTALLNSPFNIHTIHRIHFRGGTIPCVEVQFTTYVYAEPSSQSFFHFLYQSSHCHSKKICSKTPCWSSSNAAVLVTRNTFIPPTVPSEPSNKSSSITLSEDRTSSAKLDVPHTLPELHILLIQSHITWVAFSLTKLNCQHDTKYAIPWQTLFSGTLSLDIPWTKSIGLSCRDGWGGRELRRREKDQEGSQGGGKRSYHKSERC